MNNSGLKKGEKIFKKVCQILETIPLSKPNACLTQDLMQFCGDKFSLKTAIMIAFQVGDTYISVAKKDLKNEEKIEKFD